MEWNKGEDEPCSRPEETADDVGLGAVAVHGRHEGREAVAQVVDLPVEFPDVVARLLQ